MGHSVVIGATVLDPSASEGEHLTADELLADIEYTPEQVEAWEADPNVPRLLSEFIDTQIKEGKAVYKKQVEELITTATECVYLIASLQLEGEPKSLFWIVENVPGIYSGKYLLYSVGSLGMSEGLMEKTVDDEGTPYFALTEAGKKVDTEATLGLMAARYDAMEEAVVQYRPKSVRKAISDNALGTEKEAGKQAKSMLVFVVKVVLAVALVFLIVYPIFMSYFG